MVTREDCIEQSVQDFVRERLLATGYADSIVEVRDAFPTPNERTTPLTKNVVCLGFNFDDGGRPAELGSALIKRVYTIDFWVFGRTQKQGRNVATAIRTFVEDADWLIPLKDVGTAGHPEIDKLIIQDERGIPVSRQVSNDPRPWDLNVFSVAIKAEDWYFPSAVN